MSFKLLYKEVLLEYQLQRDANEKELQRRIKEIYKIIPRIKEIDMEKNHNGINLLRLIGLDKEELEVQIQNMKQKNSYLIKEKYKILEQNGYPANYLDKIYKCIYCKDTGRISTQKCECLNQKIINKYYNISNLSNIIQEENFDNFDFRYYSKDINKSIGTSPHDNIQTVYRTCMKFTQNINTEFTNIFLYGNTGLGKTFLCNCIAKDLLDNNKSVIYLTAPRFFKKVEEQRFNKNNIDMMDMIFQTDVLIIDDLGTEFSTIITSTELFNIINTRIIEKKPTIISSNLSLQELKTIYTERIISRFNGNFEMLNLYGDDIRRKKKYKLFC